MMNTAHCNAVCSYFSVTNNSHFSPCAFPPMWFSDTFKLRPAVSCSLGGRLRAEKWGLLIIPFLSIFKPINNLSISICGLKDAFKKMG